MFLQEQIKGIIIKCVEGAGQKEVSCAGLRGPARASRPALGGVIGMFWGLLSCVHVSRSRRSSMSGGAASNVSHGRVHVVGNVPAHVPGGCEAPSVELQIGVDTAGRYVVLIRQIMQCARIVGECAANKAMRVV